MIGVLEGIDMYKLVQLDTRTYELHLVSQRPDKERLSEDVLGVLRRLYGQEANIAVIYDADIAPESSGKYLVSRTIFPVDLDDYLDKDTSLKND
jgi:hypothetical protein